MYVYPKLSRESTEAGEGDRACADQHDSTSRPSKHRLALLATKWFHVGPLTPLVTLRKREKFFNTALKLNMQ